MNAFVALESTRHSLSIIRVLYHAHTHTHNNNNDSFSDTERCNVCFGTITHDDDPIIQCDGECLSGGADVDADVDADSNADVADVDAAADDDNDGDNPVLQSLATTITYLTCVHS